MPRGRPICTDTKLGRIIVARNLNAYDVSTAGGFSSRTMTEYLAGRRIIRTEHLVRICRFLNVEPEDIVEEALKENLTNSHGKPRDPNIKSVRDLPKIVRDSNLPTEVQVAV